MKKIMSIMLSIILVLSTLSVAAFAAEGDTVKFAVATDIHTRDYDEEIPVNYPESELYFHAQNSGILYWQTIGIFRSFITEAVNEGAEFVLLPGDISNAGSEKQHLYMAEQLHNFEIEFNIPIYVVPGNHDLYRSSPAEFAKYYAELGYNEAIATDTETASYVVDLPGNIRLLCIDSNDAGDDGDGLDERLFSWIEEQANAGHDAGKTVLAMMHHPLLEPIPFAETLMKDFIVRDHEEVAERFTQYGIECVFTGHEHGNNISSYTGTNGKTVYDVLTTALTSYPLEYRMITLDENQIDVKVNGITECDFDYVREGYTEKQLELMRTDYTEYSRGYFKYSVEKKIAGFITPEFIAKKLNVTEGALYDAIYAVMPVVEEALQMPLYEKDTDGLSVEKLAKECSATMPESDYYNLYDLATSVVCDIYYGAENKPMDSSPEGKVLIVGLNTMLKYILAEAGNRATTLALNSIFEGIGLDEIEGVDLFRWNRSLVLGADHSYEVAFSVLSPLIDKFMVDDEICDRDAVLLRNPEPAETNKVETFFEKIYNFFKYILSILKTAMFIKF